MRAVVAAMLERITGQIVLLWMQLSARLPQPLAQTLSRPGGAVLQAVMRRRAAVVTANLRHCFPHWSASEVAQWRRRMFRALAYSFYEIALSWCRRDSTTLPACQINGLQHVHQAQADQRGILLVCGHYTTMEITGRLIAEQVPLHAVYRPLRNRVLERFQNRGRGRYTKGLISKREPGRILRELKRGGVVWMAPDQDFGPARSQFVDFFGRPTATLSAVWRLAQASNAVVLTMQPQRLGDGCYRIDIEPPLPAGDAASMLQNMNQRLEAQVRRQPDQYWWLHRRFKTRPQGVTDLYSS
ncbi:MAG: lysophospholipid acyltransferase family protein [Gammaproteobacteria bacterium]|nr:lysophospholipid acyltransferase family protein [Gammaproteobacteria bacterium]